MTNHKNSTHTVHSHLASPRSLRFGASIMLMCLALPAVAQTTGRTTSNEPRTSPSYSTSDTTQRRSTGDTSLKRGDRRFIMKAAENGKKEMALAHLAVERAENAQVRAFAQTLVDDHQKLDDAVMTLAQQKGVMLDDMPPMHRTEARDSRAGVNQTPGYSSTDPVAPGSSHTPGVSSTDPVAPRSNAYTPTGRNSSSDTRYGADGKPSSKWSEMFGSDRVYRRLAKETGAEFDEEFIDTMVDAHEDGVKLFEKASRDSSDPELSRFAAQHVPTLRGHLERARTLKSTMKN